MNTNVMLVCGDKVWVRECHQRVEEILERTGLTTLAVVSLLSEEPLIDGNERIIIYGFQGEKELEEAGHYAWLIEKRTGVNVQTPSSVCHKTEENGEKIRVNRIAIYAPAPRMRKICKQLDYVISTADYGKQWYAEKHPLREGEKTLLSVPYVAITAAGAGNLRKITEEYSQAGYLPEKMLVEKIPGVALLGIAKKEKL